MVKIASWNINSVRLRLPLLTYIITKYNFDIICLQETKTRDEFFPEKELRELGYPYVLYRGEKSYNGVAILSKIEIKEDFFWDMCTKGDKRHIAVKLENDVVLHNFYVPAGGDIPDPEINEKFAHKLAFVDEMQERLIKDKQGKAIIVGDFNIAPLEHDVWSHKQLLKIVSHTPIEVEKLNSLKNSINWVDSHRYFVPEDEKLYSWWSYRSKDWRKSDRGRRLDHIWVTDNLSCNLQKANIYKETRGFEQPSDHCVISIELEL